MSLLWGLVVVVVADAIAIAAILLVRRRAPEGSYFTDGDRASGVFGMLATGFAIFAGFVIFLAFTTYDDSLAGGDAEALIVVQQFETAQFLAPSETRDALTGQLVCYGRSVVHEEWPGCEAGDLEERPINPWASSSSARSAPHIVDRATADGVRQVARPDVRSGRGAARPRYTARRASRRRRCGSSFC